MFLKNHFKNILERTAQPALFLLLPFLMFYWTFPFISSQTLGNDYTRPVQLFNQMELMFSLRRGTFPLYVPGFYGGEPSSVLTMGQLFHPISYVAALIPAYWKGHAYDVMTLLRLLSLGAAHWVLYSLLKKMNIAALFAFLITLVTVYNQRMLDCFRFWAALENYTGCLLLCAALIWHCLKPSRVWTPLGIIASSYLLVTGGHAQMMYYGFLVSTVIIFTVPFYLNDFKDINRHAWKTPLRYYAEAFGWMGTGLLLASAYFLPFYYDFYLENTNRVGQSFNWALSRWNMQTMVSVVNSVLKPLYSNVHGSFGGSALVVPAFLIPLLYGSKQIRSKSIGVIWLLIIIVMFLSPGKLSFLYYYFWKYMPFASSFRVPSRLTFMCPILLMLILTWLVQLPVLRFRFMSRKRVIAPYALLGLVSLLIYAVYQWLPLEAYDTSEKYSPASIRQPDSTAHILSYAGGAATLLLVFIYGFLRCRRRVIGLLLASVVIAHIALIMSFGTWQNNRPRSMTFEEMVQHKQESVNYLATVRDAWGLGSRVYQEHQDNLNRRKKKGLKAPLARIYWDYTHVHSVQETYRYLEGRHFPHRYFVMGFDDVAPLEEQTLPPAAAPEGEVRLVENTFNKLVFDMRASHEGFFAINYPYFANWRAIVDGREEAIYRGNGIQQAVWIGAGSHRVEFRYFSWASFLGFFISCITLACVAVYFAGQIKTALRRRLVMWAAVTGCFLVFVVWHYSLYHGESLGTQYHWRYP